jgi:hypothetical protein
MRVLFALALLLLFAGCISNTQESNGNKIVKIISEKIYNESEEQNWSREENISPSENITNIVSNETETNTMDLNITDETFEAQNHSENETKKIDGTYFGNNAYVLVLRDISMQRNEEGYCALFEILWAENGSSLQKLQICPGEDAYWTSPDGHQYRIKVFETAAGYSGGARWAKAIVYG